MHAHKIAPAGSEFEFTSAQFDTLRRLVREHTGITLNDTKREMVYGRLSRRLRRLNLTSFAQYLALLESGDGSEMRDFINAVTTNLTAFFREPHHFEFLADTVLPELVARRGPARRLRIWSAGCSTGEEPYSIAMTLREAAARLTGWDTRILATDIDTNVLATAAAGVYPLERTASIPESRRRRWFKLGEGDLQGRAAVVDEARDLVRFRHLNLMGEWPFKGRFDVIFCRNVVIYFDKDTQRRLFDRYADALTDDGFLFVGHSETLYRVTERFALLGRTVYRKVR
ncbi:MAG: protein-glutamate O-methyltransferase CheR [Gammaproteobacteria bacterium]